VNSISPYPATNASSHLREMLFDQSFLAVCAAPYPHCVSPPLLSVCRALAPESSPSETTLASGVTFGLSWPDHEENAITIKNSGEVVKS